MGELPEYDTHDALGLAALVRTRQVQPAELVEEAIRRIEALNPQLNAVVQETYDRARAQALGDLPDGPFRGVPFLLKDLLALDAGVPVRMGSRFLKDFVPGHDSELVRRHKAAGLVIVGRTNTPEFGLAPVTEPALYGPCRNPWDLSRTPGGSSGGSAAAVAARLVPAAHGNDGGGSIRIPASCCGLFGLKPTRARTPDGPDRADAWQGLACGHVLTRSVRDSAALLDATAGPEAGAPYVAPAPARPFLDEVGADPGRLRVAFTARPFLPAPVHEDCLGGLAEVVALLQELGHQVEEAAPQIDGEALLEAFMVMAYGETRAALAEVEALVGRRATVREIEPATWAAGLMGGATSAAEYARALNLLKGTAGQVAPFFEQYDVLLTPTLASPPLAIGAQRLPGIQALGLELLNRLHAGRLIRLLARLTRAPGAILSFAPFTPPFNATGQPAMSVPLYWNREGLPIGMQFVARYGDEATLFRLAAQLEAARPWSGRRPPLCDQEGLGKH
jgi:amidase